LAGAEVACSNTAPNCLVSVNGGSERYPALIATVRRRQRCFGSVVASAAAGATLALLPLWWHVDLVDPGVQGIIAVFAEVGVYPTDACLAALAVLAVARPTPVEGRARCLALGLAVFTAAALASSWTSLDPRLTAGLAAQLALLSLAWLGLRSGKVPRIALVSALVASAMLQSVLAALQFVVQQPVVPPQLQLPWLPANASDSGAPVVLNAAGDRLLRGFGTFPHPNVLGGYLAVALVCVPVLGQRWRRCTWLWWIVGCVIGLGLLASFSRAAWLGAGLGLCVWWRWSPSRTPSWRLATGIAVAAAGIALSPIAPTVAARAVPLGPTANALERGSVENRLALDRGAVAELVRHLPLGAGGANYGVVVLADSSQQGWGEPAPNLVLLILAELGVPGALALGLLVVGTVRLLRSDGRADVVAIAACLALLAPALLDHYLWTMPPGRTLAWTSFALIATARSLDRGRTLPP
jgi:hypothetical protein